MKDISALFQNQQYLNLETFRKNKTGVKTPVWFAQEGETLYIWTQADSGKAKRIRNNPAVNIAPSKADGTPLGEWHSATAGVDASEAAIHHARTLFTKKYGLAFRLFAWLGVLRRIKNTAVKIKLTE